MLKYHFSKSPRQNFILHKLSSFLNPTTFLILDTPEEKEDSEEVADGRTAVVNIKGQKRVYHAPTTAVSHNPNPPANTLTLDWVYPLTLIYLKQ